MIQGRVGLNAGTSLSPILFTVLWRSKDCLEHWEGAAGTALSLSEESFSGIVLEGKKK